MCHAMARAVVHDAQTGKSAARVDSVQLFVAGCPDESESFDPGSPGGCPASFLALPARRVGGRDERLLVTLDPLHDPRCDVTESGCQLVNGLLFVGCLPDSAPTPQIERPCGCATGRRKVDPGLDMDGTGSVTQNAGTAGRSVPPVVGERPMVRSAQPGRIIRPGRRFGAAEPHLEERFQVLAGQLRGHRLQILERGVPAAVGGRPFLE